MKFRKMLESNAEHVPPLIYGKDIQVVKATADPKANEDRAAMQIDPNPPGVTLRPFTDAEKAALDAPLPADLQALLDDESVVLPGEERAWRKLWEWVRGRR